MGVEAIQEPGGLQGRLVRSGGAILSVLDSGGEGDPIVLLHGLGGHASEWEETTSALRRTFRVLAVDLRGHGNSTARPKDVSPAALIGDVVAVISSLVGAVPVTLVGQSLGGHLAMLVAGRRPDLVGRLVMVESGVRGGTEASVQQVETWLRSWPASFADRSVASRWFEGQGMTPGAARAWSNGLRAGEGGLLPAFQADVLVQTLRLLDAEARWSDWTGVSQPTLLVLGQHGAINPNEVWEMVCARPEAVTSHCIVDGGHDIHLDQPTVWLDLLLRFLTSQTPGTGRP
jgi:pimeloyl-ACP methyl ester carboxylesterase